MSAHDDPIHGEWTPDEQAQLGALGDERFPNPALKATTLDALARGGLVRPERRVPTSMVIGFALAASLLFAAGAFVGYSAASSRAPVQPEHDRVAVREVARIDSATATTPTRHVVWYGPTEVSRSLLRSR